MRAATASFALCGCVVEARPLICPDVMPGDLVITEISAAHEDDLVAAYVEVANVSGHGIDLVGLHLRMLSLGGGTDVDMVVRAPVELPDGAYFVIGFAPTEMRPAGVDVGIGDDYAGDILEEGLLDLVVCGEVIDEVVYDALPEPGTWSLGVTPPDADANDDPERWCIDDELPATVGLHGTPGEANRPCD